MCLEVSAACKTSPYPASNNLHTIKKPKCCPVGYGLPRCSLSFTAFPSLFPLADLFTPSLPQHTLELYFPNASLLLLCLPSYIIFVFLQWIYLASPLNSNTSQVWPGTLKQQAALPWHRPWVRPPGNSIRKAAKTVQYWTYTVHNTR